MTVTIYHNPDCGTSRNVLALLRHAGIDPIVVEYLKTPPTRQTLTSLIARSGLTPRDVLRKKGTPYGDLGLGDPAVTDEDRIAAMLSHPILINRPLVDTGTDVRLCRPSDVVLDLLGDVGGDFRKEDGAFFLRDAPIASDDADFAKALADENLPTDDLREPGRTFFSYRTLSKSPAGYAGFERFGQDALVRSLVVPKALRGQSIGRNLVALLLYRAYVAGARRAWLLATSAAGYFEKIGFKAIERTDAPESVLSTRQAQNLCPHSAKLLTRTIGF